MIVPATHSAAILRAAPGQGAAQPHPRAGHWACGEVMRPVPFISGDHQVSATNWGVAVIPGGGTTAGGPTHPPLCAGARRGISGKLQHDELQFDYL